MTNVNELTQPNNQEIILEEISDDQLEGVVGAGLLGSLGRAVGTLVVRVFDAADEVAGTVLSFGPPQ
ncbi:MAG: hypothetical protein RMZ42_05695 [Nostoc sp. DedQUE05]|uniref:hypothetical protein n=1 Tax=Nostoc sp. DedQUE05 TaxID=3075391 RepID=UPI002AD2031A|nr:hypothetical protein [Nostoc sp. DedQUE05]MDZ8091420.1 hypothetical protein [Nostoc sp. DedQUE05]